MGLGAGAAGSAGAGPTCVVGGQPSERSRSRLVVGSRARCRHSAGSRCTVMWVSGSVGAPPTYAHSGVCGPAGGGQVLTSPWGSFTRHVTGEPGWQGSGGGAGTGLCRARLVTPSRTNEASALSEALITCG